MLTLNGQDLTQSQSKSQLHLSVGRTRLICIRLKPESKLLALEACKERILNSSTAKCLELTEKNRRANFIKLKYYYKLAKNQMNKQEMQQLVDNDIKYKT